MKHCTRLFTPAQCLLAALSPSNTRLIPTALTRNLPSTQTRPVYRGSKPINGDPRVRPARPKFDRLAEFTKDEDIEAFQVRIRGPVDENGHATLSEPQILRHLLRDLDREKQCIIQLSKTTDVPVVQVSDKEDLLKQVREKERHIKQQQKESKDRKPKQIEMNWAIDPHDLENKLRQLENFLEKGKRVEIMLAAKRKGRRAEMAEGIALLKQIRSRLSEMEAKEVKMMEGEVLRLATLFVQKKPAVR